MEILLLTVIFCGTVWFIARYIKRALKGGEPCQTCHDEKNAGCGSHKANCDGK